MRGISTEPNAGSNYAALEITVFKLVEIAKNSITAKLSSLGMPRVTNTKNIENPSNISVKMDTKNS